MYDWYLNERCLRLYLGDALSSAHVSFVCSLQITNVMRYCLLLLLILGHQQLNSSTLCVARIEQMNMLWQWSENCTVFFQHSLSPEKKQEKWKNMFVKRLYDMLPIFIMPNEFEFEYVVWVSEFFLALPFLFVSLFVTACAIKTNLFSWQPESFTHRRQQFFCVFALNGPRKIYSGKLIGFIFVCVCACAYCLVRLTKSIMKFVIKFNDMIAACVSVSDVFFLSFSFVNFFRHQMWARECRWVYFWGFVDLCDHTVRVIHNSHIFAVR